MDLASRGVSADQAVVESRSLDWLNFFVGNIQTGFGPFIAIYLTAQGWSETAIGLALSFGTLAAMASQIPAGALVDVVRAKAGVILLSMLAFSLSALLFAARPAAPMVYLGQFLHSFSSCTISPAIAAVSLAVAGEAGVALRFGRNARFAALGNGLGAAMMGACGYLVSPRAVFFLTAVLSLPGIAPLLPLLRLDRSAASAALRPISTRVNPIRVLARRPLLVFAGAVMLFTLGNAALLPLLSNTLTRSGEHEASLVVGAAIIVPQAVVALSSPCVGRFAEVYGRRIVLLLGLLSLPIRGIVFALTAAPAAVIAAQALDGLAGAGLGVLVPLVTSDLAGRSGHYNLALAAIGFAVGIGATASTTLGGWLGDHFGQPIAFVGLAACGLAACALAATAMPETRPTRLPKSAPK